jgi:uncharacterized membrane protein
VTSYVGFKIVHVLGVVLFMGNIVVTGFWKAIADRCREPHAVAFAQHLVTLTDWLFTFGGLVLILIGGYGMAAVGHLDLQQKWLAWGQGLLAASGVIWVAVLVPTQIAQAKLARSFAQGGAIPERYWQLNRRWVLFGIVATALPLANLYFMVAKP